MGGTGSGSWIRWDSKATTESRLRVDGTVGSLQWTCRGEPSGRIEFQTKQDRLILNYRIRINDAPWESVEEVVPFDWTPCNYGGQRIWFLCPHCEHRVVVLYNVGKRFLCRHCGNLTYTTQQENPPDRLLTKARKIAKRLGDDGTGAFSLPAKPKGMHWRTYQRLAQQAMGAERKGWRLAAERFGPVMAPFLDTDF